VLAWWVASL